MTVVNEAAPADKPKFVLKKFPRKQPKPGATRDTATGGGDKGIGVAAGDEGTRAPDNARSKSNIALATGGGDAGIWGGSRAAGSSLEKEDSRRALAHATVPAQTVARGAGAAHSAGNQTDQASAARPASLAQGYALLGHQMGRGGPTRSPAKPGERGGWAPTGRGGEQRSIMRSPGGDVDWGNSLWGSEARQISAKPSPLSLTFTSDPATSYSKNPSPEKHSGMLPVPYTSRLIKSESKSPILEKYSGLLPELSPSPHRARRETSGLKPLPPRDPNRSLALASSGQVDAPLPGQVDAPLPEQVLKRSLSPIVSPPGLPALGGGVVAGDSGKSLNLAEEPDQDHSDDDDDVVGPLDADEVPQQVSANTLRLIDEAVEEEEDSMSASKVSRDKLHMHVSVKGTLGKIESALGLQHEQAKLRVCVGTWNMGGKPCPDDVRLSEWLEVGSFDVYAVGVQECEAAAGVSVANQRPMWEKKLAACMGEGYELLAQHCIGTTHLACFVRKGIKEHCHDVHTAHVITGVGKMVANKAGIGLAFDYRHTSFLFVTAHFAAHLNKVATRNANYARIDKELFRLMCPKEAALLPRQASMSIGRQLSGIIKVEPAQQDLAGTSPPRPSPPVEASVSARFDRVFWFGDFNYRLAMQRDDVDAILAEAGPGYLKKLLQNDQLIQQRAAEAVFKGFEEAKIRFHPTYKFDKYSDAYDSSKKARVQAWTDRVLHRSKQGGDTAQGPNPIRVLKYASIDSIRASDHRPVVAHFEVSEQEAEGGSERGMRAAHQKGSAACTIL